MKKFLNEIPEIVTIKINSGTQFKEVMDVFEKRGIGSVSIIDLTDIHDYHFYLQCNSGEFKVFTSYHLNFMSAGSFIEQYGQTYDSPEIDFNPELLKRFAESLKGNKKAFSQIKNIAVQCGSYETGIAFSSLEKELFPYSDMEIKAKNIQDCLAMLDIKIPVHVAWAVYRAIVLYESKGNAFSIMDAAQIQAEVAKNFDRN
jgi:hypothetical protein